MDLVTIARLRRPRGNKGELIGDSLTSHPERFQQLKRVTLKDDKGVVSEAEVESVWDFRGEPVFKFVGVDSINAAEPFAGRDVCVPPEERVPLEEDEYFFGDIVGCEALAMDGSKIGTVAGWQELPGQVLFEVEDAAGIMFLVPFVTEIFRGIDVAGRKVRLDLPPGLRELNAGASGQ